MATILDPRFKQISKMSSVMKSRPSKQLGIAIFQKLRVALTTKPMIQQKLF
jgi:hypothetical protein